MPGPGEHKTVHAHIMEYAEEIGWTCVSHAKGCTGLSLTPFHQLMNILERYPVEMRWLKNKVYYGSITPKAVEKFK